MTKSKPQKSSKSDRPLIFLSLHLLTHGLAYLKHTLTALRQGQAPLLEVEEGWHSKALNQPELHQVWDEAPKAAPNGLDFDKIYIIYPQQEAMDQVSTRIRRRSAETQDEVFIRENTNDIWNFIYEHRTKHASNLVDEEKWMQAEYPQKFRTLQAQMWRQMQHYPFEFQRQWLETRSNITQVYEPEQLNFVPLNGPKDPRNLAETMRYLSSTLRRLLDQHPNAQWVVNASLIGYEFQICLHILAESGWFPEDTLFFSCYDDKNTLDENRFKEFYIRRIPVRIFSQLHLPFDFKDAPPSRQLAAKKLEVYINMGFSILILGERGTGKTHLVKQIQHQHQQFGSKTFVEANCASFDDDSKAEAELFGYAKGAFTGAAKDSPGLFKKAQNGVLFLDEVHHLSRRVQAKLMTALSTDQENRYTIRPLGGEAEQLQCTVVFASNQSIYELRKLLYPDFFDRITQLVIEMPALKKDPQHRERDWSNIWSQLKLDETLGACPREPQLLKWLRDLPLYGNYRDLQKIAMYYASFQRFDGKLRKLIGPSNAFEFAKQEFEAYAANPENQAPNQAYLRRDLPPKAAIEKLQKDWAIWAEGEFGSLQKAEDFYGSHPKNIKYRQLHNWRKQNDEEEG